jgi:hypothetical protein
MILSRQQAGGTKQQQDLTYQTCDDVQPGNAQCTNRDPTAPAYQWTPGVNKCPNSFKQTFAGFSASNFVNQPLCPDCLPSTQNHGSDGGGTTYFDDDLLVVLVLRSTTDDTTAGSDHGGALIQTGLWIFFGKTTTKMLPTPELTHFVRFFSIWFSPPLSDFFGLF